MLSGPEPQVSFRPNGWLPPASSSSSHVGTLSVNDCMTERDWTPDEIAAVEGLSFAIDRAESDAHVSDVTRLTRPFLNSAGGSVGAAKSRKSR